MHRKKVALIPQVNLASEAHEEKELGMTQHTPSEAKYSCQTSATFDINNAVYLTVAHVIQKLK